MPNGYSTPKTDANPASLPPVGPEIARCWCTKCQIVLLDRNPQVRAGMPWDGPNRPDATVLQVVNVDHREGWKAVCPNCGNDGHLEDLTTYGPWRSAPGWKEADAEAWIAHAVEAIGPGFHPDTRAEDYDWPSIYIPGPWPLEHERAAFKIGLARAHVTLGDRIYDVGLREFQRWGWAPPTPN